jgi:Zn-dependent protease
MNSGWRIGSIFGIPLRLDPSWFFIMLLVTFLYGSDWQARGWTPSIAWTAGFVTALLLFVSALLHELGHSLVALSQGLRVSSITLFLFGGVASIEQESKTPGRAFQVAIAGPLVSFVLGAALLWGGEYFHDNLSLSEVLERLAWFNLAIACFNMIPGLPLDGGQVLKAIVWKITGSRMKGVRSAAKVGQILGWVGMVTGVILYFQTFNLSFLWLAFIGWFCIRNASAYNIFTDIQEALLSLTAAATMTREFRVVDARLTLHQFADEYLQENQTDAVYYAAAEGRYRGLIAPDELKEIERSRWDTESISSIAHPLDEIPAVRETTPITEVIDRLEVEKLRRITVLSPAGAVAGVVDRGDIVRALAIKSNLPISEMVIKRIKEEGAYPPGFQLAAIAKSAIE